MDFFLCLLIASIAFLVLYGLVRICSGKQGTWTRAAAPTFEPLVLHGGAEQDSAGEQRVRSYLERFFEGQTFSKVRPFFLSNTVTGQNLELDCYNDELKLAVEYNGRQHYEYVPFFHSNREAFRNQQYRDELKRIYCRDHGIRLITVPFTEKNIELYLARKLDELSEKTQL